LDGYAQELGTLSGERARAFEAVRIGTRDGAVAAAAVLLHELAQVKALGRRFEGILASGDVEA